MNDNYHPDPHDQPFKYGKNEESELTKRNHRDVDILKNSNILFFFLTLILVESGTSIHRISKLYIYLVMTVTKILPFENHHGDNCGSKR